MVTRVLAKTTKFKNNFINGKKNFKRILSCPFGGRRKVQVTNLPSRSSSLFSVPAANSVGTTLEFTAFGCGPGANPAELVPSGFFLSTTMVFAAIRTHFPRKNTRVFRNTVTCVTRVTSNRVEVHRLNSQHLAMVRTSNTAELVPSVFSVYNHGFLQQSEHISARKTPVHMSIALRSINSMKMRPLFYHIAEVVQRLSRSLYVPVVRQLGGSNLLRGKCFPFFLFLGNTDFKK